MIFRLLTDATSSGAGAEPSSPWLSWVFLGVMVGAVVLLLFFNRRSQKKRMDETQAMLNAIKPGNKVKTIGGICGIVIELCPEDNTFVLETGTEVSGKSYLKFDMQAVYQTDAVVEKPVEAPVESATETTVETPAEETPVEESKTEENTEVQE